MNVKILKGPLFEQKKDDVYRYIGQLIKQDIEKEKKVHIAPNSD